MAQLSSPLPDGPIGFVTDPRSGKPVPVLLDTDAWDPYFRSLERSVQSSPSRLKIVTLSGESASIGTTPVPLPSLATGLYRVTVEIQQTQAATVNASLNITLTWTRGGVVQTKMLAAALVANTVTTRDGFTVLARIDAGTPISYAVAYASTGATPALFDLDVVVEAVPA